VNALVLLWKRFEPGARISLALGVLAVLGLTGWLAYEMLRVDYDVLFTQLTESDAATIVDQLKKQKTPYHLTGDGTTIEVPALQVHETRLRLMSSGVPLAGGIGFEIFDKQGLGATEQSQRVSYQRALQGELARTIGALEGVRQARVHLVLPESALFRRDKQDARAAITLSMKGTATLKREQILGVQRLVAASVPGLDPDKVVVTDQRGVTLSGADSLGGETWASERRLEMKREIEEYLTRKVARLLDSAFGPGQAIVSVDASLNFDEIRRTVQDLQPSAVRRRRQVSAGNNGIDDSATPAADLADGTAKSTSSTEIEYEYGRKVEQVIGAPGGISRLSVGVVVPGDLPVDKQQRIAELVRMAAGVNEARGDAVVVQPLDQLGVTRPAQELAVADEPPASIVPKVERDSFVPFASISRPSMLLGGTAVALIILFLVRRRVAVVGRVPAGDPPALSPRERESLLLEIEKVLDTSPSSSSARTRP
jgi:flagellar M-ring protein FliF